ncbi:larval cuticle protein 65Ag1 [Drosophila guanche]|uniref:Blast:Larval cuticle protein 8 n=1 Tax=Drosophila guanche TaxID=7266 RepID=A0A3B0KMU2_DROGU|nr:larval cuticle protein 65Ag1 [Drosophila guanche]SPP85128.1 blast:Larval cuticle protein 8 [Drosophila guanche]
MKCVLLIVFVSIALCMAAPADNVQIVKLESQVLPDGYSYAYETSDGSKQEQQATLKKLGPEEEALQVTGSYSYVGDDGQTYTVTYTANENGFQPQGEHIPHV